MGAFDLYTGALEKNVKKKLKKKQKRVKKYLYNNVYSRTIYRYDEQTFFE